MSLFHGCKARNSSVSVTSGSYPGSVANLTSEDWDTDAYHSNSTNPSRITIPTGLGGKYQIGATIGWGTDSTVAATRAVYYRKNGTIVGGIRDGDAGSFLVDSFSDEITLAEGDYLELNPYQETGTTLTGCSVAFWVELIDPDTSDDKKISELVAITDLVGTEEFVVADDGASKRITADDLAAALGGGGGLSPIDIPPDSPNAFDDEFDDSASLSDWTAYGATPTTEDINTTVAGRLYMRRSPSAARLAGRYKSITIPGTYKVALGATSVRENYNRGLNVVILGTGAISDSSPCVGIGSAYGDGHLSGFVERMSDLSSYAATIYNVNAGPAARPVKQYLLLIFNSTTSVDLYWSVDGIAWIPQAIAYNPGWAMDKLGWGMRSDSSTAALEGSIDWIRRVA